MTTYKLATVGSSQTVANELLAAAKEIVGRDQGGKAYAIKDLNDHNVADVFLCLPTRVKEASQKIPMEKIVVLELKPDTAFYVKVAYIKKPVAYVFNNNMVQAEKISEYCREQGINHIEFLHIPYDEISEEEIINRLSKAEIIIGADTIVGSGGALYKKFGQYLPPNVEIIGAKRVATDQSVANIIRWTTLYHHKKVVDEIALTSTAISEQLTNIELITHEFDEAMKNVSSTIRQANEKNAKMVGSVKQSSEIASTLSEAVKKSAVSLIRFGIFLDKPTYWPLTPPSRLPG